MLLGLFFGGLFVVFCLYILFVFAFETSVFEASCIPWFVLCCWVFGGLFL